MATLATGQITIIDLNDALTLQGYLASDKALNQIVDKNGATTVSAPDWTVSANQPIISAVLYVLGKANGGDLLASSIPTEVAGIKWYYTLGGTAEVCAYKEVFGAGRTNDSVFGAGDPAASGWPTWLQLSGDARKVKVVGNPFEGAATSATIRCAIYYKQGALPAIPYNLTIPLSSTSAGQSAYTVLLTNESASISTNTTGSTTSASTITIKAMAYKGADRVAAAITKPADGSGFTYALSTGDYANDTLTITVANASTLTGSDNGTVTLTVTVDGKAFSKVFSWSKSKTGGAGSDAKAVDLTGPQVFKYASNTTTYTPTSLALVATKNAAITGTGFAWSYDIGAGFVSVTPTANTWAIGSGTGNSTLTIDPAKSGFPGWGTANSMTIKVTIEGATDTITIYKVSDGATPINVQLMAPNGDTFKNIIGNGTTLPVKVSVYEGLSDVTATIGTANGYRWLYQDLAVAANTTVGTATTAGTTVKLASKVGFAVNQEIAILNGVNEIYRGIISAVNATLNEVTVLDTLPNLTVGWTVKATGFIYLSADLANQIINTGSGSSEVTVYPDFVTNMRVIKCSPLYKSVRYHATLPILDITDPYAIRVDSSAGDVFKNGEGDSDLTAVVYQNGAILDPGATLFKYEWVHRDSSGAAIANWHPVPVNVGAAIAGITLTHSTANSASATISASNANFVAGKYYVFGNETVARKVAAINGTSVTFDKAPTTALGSALAIKPVTDNMKVIHITASEVSEIGTFFASIVD